MPSLPPSSAVPVEEGSLPDSNAGDSGWQQVIGSKKLPTEENLRPKSLNTGLNAAASGIILDGMRKQGKERGQGRVYLRYASRRKDAGGDRE
jgi:hypothetical protein